MREGWISDNFSNCFKLKSGDNLTKKNMQEGPYPVYGGNGIAGHHSKFNLEGQNILIGRVGAICGNARFVNEKVWLTDNAFKIEDTYYDFDYRFLEYLLNFLNLKSYARQTAQPVISNSSLKKVRIEFPKLLQEQKLIVAILDDAFEVIDQAKANIERNIQNAEELFQSKSNEIFSQPGESWEEKMLKEACEINPSKRQVKNKLSDDDLVSFVPMSHLEINRKYFHEESIKPLGEVYKGYTYFEDGDVLLAKITPCFENGKLGIALNLENGIGFGSSEYIVYRPQVGLLNEFLYYFFNRDSFRRIGESLMGGAVGHQRIQKVFYEDFIISYPELSKQQEIVSELDAVSIEKAELIVFYKRKISALEELKKSILQKAFSGELTANDQVPA